MAKTETEVKDLWLETKEVYVPRNTRGEQPTLWVCVNGRPYTFPKGQRVTVPLPVALVVENMQAQELETMERADAEFKGFGDAK